MKPRRSRRRLWRRVTWGQIRQAPHAWTEALWQLGREHPWTMGVVIVSLAGIAVWDILNWIF